MKIFVGKVISKKMQKTATVAVERVVVHPIYQKRVKRRRKYHVHDTVGVEVGQSVKFVASKPFSKTKRWVVLEVLKKGEEKAKPKKLRTKKAKNRQKF